MYMVRKFNRLLAAAVMPLCAACSPIGVVVGVGSEMGSAAISERGLAGSVDDLRIKSQVLATLADYEGDLFSDLIVIAHDEELVLAGYVASEQDRDIALRLVKSIPGIAGLAAYIQVQPALSLSDYAHDALINARIRTGMLMDGGILSVNFTVNTLAGTVYLVGTAQDHGERQRLVAIARGTAYVRDVVDLTRVKPAPEHSAQDRVQP